MPVAKKKTKTTTTRRTKKVAAAPEAAKPTFVSAAPKATPAASAQQSTDFQFAKKLLLTLLGILLAYLIIYLGTLIRNNIEAYAHIGEADTHERVISLESVGTAIAKPDIAMTSMGVAVEAETVAEAQEKNSAVLNSLITRLKDMGIAKEDIETANYNIAPRYDYTEEEGRVLRGYEVNQQVSVKIRKVDSASAVIALAGELGVTNVSGLTFTIDDTDVYLEAAREDALKKLRAKIDDITGKLGITVVEIVSYDEYPESNIGPYPVMALDRAYGGGAPMIESGSDEIKLRVRVNLEIES